MASTGPSIRAVVRVLNSNSCGSGSICGLQPDGRCIILTNAHVAGSQVGRVVNCDVESTGDSIQARVIMAAYSNKTSTDWAVMESVKPYNKVQPVKLSKRLPTGSHYTKGFPRCKAFPGSDIRTVRMTKYTWLWQPVAIPGQSGSGVWSDLDNYQYGLVTWQIGEDGAGQTTAQIWEQARTRTTVGEPRVPGMIEIPGDDVYEMEGLNCPDDDPEVDDGFFQEAGIDELPIWAGQEKPIPPPGNKPDQFGAANFIEFCRAHEEFYESWRVKFEKAFGANVAPPVEPEPPCDDDNGGGGDGPTYGL